MSSTIEEACSDLVTGEVVDRAQTDPYHLFLGILTQRDAQLETFNLKGHIDQSFSIALDEMETFLIFPIQGIECRMPFLIDDHTVTEHVSHHAQAVL